MGRPRKFSREGVLEKALPVFWTYGFARTTLPDLEHATSVNKSGLYAEFESKEALFLACLDHYFATRSGGELLTAEPLGWGNIQHFLEQAPSCSRDQKGCFAVSSMRELAALPPAAREKILANRTELDRMLAANIAAEAPKMPVEAVTELVSSFFSGICIEANLATDRAALDRKIANFVRALRTA